MVNLENTNERLESSERKSVTRPTCILTRDVGDEQYRLSTSAIAMNSHSHVVNTSDVWKGEQSHLY